MTHDATRTAYNLFKTCPGPQVGRQPRPTGRFESTADEPAATSSVPKQKLGFGKDTFRNVTYSTAGATTAQALVNTIIRQVSISSVGQRFFVIGHANGQLHPANAIFPRINYNGLSCAFSPKITFSSTQQVNFFRSPGVVGRGGSTFSTNSTGPYRIHLKQINHHDRTTSSLRQYYTFISTSYHAHFLRGRSSIDTSSFLLFSIASWRQGRKRSGSWTRNRTARSGRMQVGASKAPDYCGTDGSRHSTTPPTKSARTQTDRETQRHYLQNQQVLSIGSDHLQ